MRLDGLLLRRCSGRRAGANAVSEAFACERRFAAGGRVVERELLELVIARRRNCEVRVGPAVRGVQDLVQNTPRPQEEPRVTPRLDGDPAPVARIEDERRFALKPMPTVAAVFEAKGAALEGVH